MTMEDMTMEEYQRSPLRARDLADIHDKLDVVEVDANFYDDMEFDTFLFHDINLSCEHLGEVETRLLRQVCRAFYGIRFDRKLDQIALAEPDREDTEAEHETFGTDLKWSSELNFPEPETGKIDPNDRGNIPILVPPEDHEADKEKTESTPTPSPIKIDRETLLNDVPCHEYIEVKYSESFPRAIFRDILYNCVKGKGSFRELLQLALFNDVKKRDLEYFRLFREGSISFETFNDEVPNEKISSYQKLHRPLERELLDDQTIDHYQRKGIPSERWRWNDSWKDTMNVMVEKIFYDMNWDWLDFAPVLINLSEKDWKGSILTDDFFELTNK